MVYGLSDHRNGGVESHDCRRRRQSDGEKDDKDMRARHDKYQKGQYGKHADGHLVMPPSSLSGCLEKGVGVAGFSA